MKVRRVAASSGQTGQMGYFHPHTLVMWSRTA